MVSKFYADASLYAPPPAVRGPRRGRPRVKGAKQPAQQEIVARQPRRQRLQVAWYGGGRRDIAVVQGQELLCFLRLCRHSQTVAPPAGKYLTARR